MISALKRLARKNEDANKAPEMPPGVSSMGQSLQRKFGRGVQYNMKMVIKGDRNTGKTTLLSRIQGKPFRADYIPTREIQVCSINWSYRVSDEIVKVEVWDVVDKGRKKSQSDGLKLANTTPENDDKISGVLDAEFLDVYKGTHGCIIIFDISKQWTFKYVERELPKVPRHIPVLVLANFLDMWEHRVVQPDEVTALIKSLDRGQNDAWVEYGECCMKNHFGLKFIHKFFNIPFLRLQRETLEKQLQVNKEDLKATLEELSLHRNSEEQDYEKYLHHIEKKINEKKPSVAAAAAAPQVDNTVPKARAVPSKKSNAVSSNVDDFVVDETIDSEFLGKEENHVQVKKQSVSEDSDSQDDVNPMVSGFQDISSDEEEDIELPKQVTPVITSLQADVEIDITPSTSENENDDVVDAKQTQALKYGGEHKPIKPVEPESLDIHNDAELNDEDSSFMDSWLDSPTTNPPEQPKDEKKSRSDNGTKLKKKTKVNKTDDSEEDVSNPQVSFKQGDDEESSSEEKKDEKKTTKVERKEKNGEEVKEKRRSKHKHKKKSRQKESGDENTESSEKSSKSKKKHRHKQSKSREKKESVDYESL